MAGELTTTEVIEPVVTNIQLQSKGFGSYLTDILPPDIATAAGAFGTSMSQIRNLSSVTFEKFAQVVTNLETSKGLNVNGTIVPADVPSVNNALPLIALGSGPRGTYTMSDFFGCMSSLPYPWEQIEKTITQLETNFGGNPGTAGSRGLYQIYRQLYLAVTWERATVTLNYNSYEVETSPGNYTTYYHVTGVNLTDPGGGFCREGAAVPTITINNSGATATAVVGTDDSNVTNFGRVTNIIFTSGSDSTSTPSVTISDPPGPNWPTMNNIVQTYIDEANTEIQRIVNTAPKNLINKLNYLWDTIGNQLSIEQRARDTGLGPLPTPRDANLTRYPTAQIVFTDSIPESALDTKPHMSAQTIEAIANLCTVGGESMVGMMRESRNQDRLTKIGIPLDNNIPDEITPEENKQLVANGILPDTIPSTLKQVDCNTKEVISPAQYGYYAPNIDSYVITNPTANPNINTEFGPSGLINSVNPDGSFNPTSAGNDPFNGVTSEVNPYGLIIDVTIEEYGGIGQDNSLLDNISQTNGQTTTQIDNNGIGGIGNYGRFNTREGKPEPLGSLAGSKYNNLISPELDPIYFSNNVLPSTPTVQESIDEVIRCNCDCWDNL